MRERSPCNSGSRARKTYCACLHGGSVDLVFADIHLPGSSLDGFGLARWIGKEHPGVKVLLPTT